MKVFLSLCLLFCLVSPAVPLTCEKCVSDTETVCEYSDTEKCLDYQSCSRTTVTGDLLPDVIDRARYGCSRCQEENFAFTTGQSGNFSLTTKCCRRDRCNAKLPQTPSESTQPNGLECLGCYAEGQNECRGVEGVRCPGDQTKCMKMSIEFVNMLSFQSRFFSARGCATPSMCDKSRVQVMFRGTDNVLLNYTVKCTDAL